MPSMPITVAMGSKVPAVFYCCTPALWLRIQIGVWMLHFFAVFVLRSVGGEARDGPVSVRRIPAKCVQQTGFRTADNGKLSAILVCRNR
jgi:hypothetical protein